MEQFGSVGKDMQYYVDSGDVLITIKFTDRLQYLILREGHLGEVSKNVSVKMSTCLFCVLWATGKLARRKKKYPGLNLMNDMIVQE